MIPRQYRFVTGLSLIGAGVVVAVLGWLGVSSETDVAFQLPYFASAGIGALLLMGGGATMILSAQLEADGERLAEIEDAIRQLADEVGRVTQELTVPRGRTLRAVNAEETGHPAGSARRKSRT